MPLRLVRSTSSRVLRDTCVDRFLADAADHPGPTGHRAHLWITHRGIRDSLLEEAHARGIDGWLAPPVSYLADLPDRFGIRARPIGLLTRRRLVARIAAEHADRLGIGVAGSRGIIRGHMMDGLLGELLPEGVRPDRLAAALEGVAGDDFARRRNEWIVAVYGDYLDELGRSGRYDWRATNALLAAAVVGGGLPDAIDGAATLHVYGIHTLRSRRRLVRALAEQDGVDVVLYTGLEDEPGEWDELAGGLGLDVEVLDDGAAPASAAESGPAAESASAAPAAPASIPRVQPAPDALREYRWIAAQIKRLLAEDGIEPHEVAVVARTGREDTRRACAALDAAGIPFTARLRTPLCDIGALKALLELFEGAADEWSYRPLRNVLAGPYFRARLDLRGVDFAAHQRRLKGLPAWADALDGLADAKEGGSDRDVRKLGVHPDRLRDDAGRLRDLAEVLAPLAEPRPERDWVERTLRFVTDGVLGLRKAASEPVAGRWDVVRFDQRGLKQLESLLREWAELDLPDDPMDVGDWHRLLERLLEAHELALSSPGQKGVQVLEAHDAALTPFRAVFATHANDGEFPKTPSSAGVLLEEERTALRQAGLPIADRELMLRRERALWRAAVQGDDVVISYRTTDAHGTPLLPSLMVPDHDPAAELPRSYEPVLAGDAAAPDDHRTPVDGGAPDAGDSAASGDGDPAGDPRELVVGPEAERRLAAVRLRRTPADAPVLTADPGALRHAILAAHAETLRGVRDETGTGALEPDPWHGELRDPAVLEHLADRFGPDHRWSASQLEGYATLPFVFLMDRVLRLGEMGEADEETTPLTFGGVAHDILQAFYDEVKADLPPRFDDRAAALFDRVTDRVLRAREASGEWVGLPVLWQYTRREIVDRVREYLAWELEYLAEKGERPVWCELTLQDDDGAPITLVGTDLAGEQQALRFTGRIDRVDVTGDGDEATHHVLDYKSSGYPKKSGYRDGSVLQAPLYLAGLETLKMVTPGKGRYRVIKKPGNPKNGCQVKAGSKDYETALRFAFSIPGRVRAGLFEPVMAKSGEWKFFHPGIEVTRGRPQLEDGSRFHG